jgi:hypothetical protein
MINHRDSASFPQIRIVGPDHTTQMRGLYHNHTIFCVLTRDYRSIANIPAPSISNYGTTYFDAQDAYLYRTIMFPPESTWEEVD